MKKTEALLCLGMAFFVLWLLITIVYPWVGFVMGVTAFLALIGFVLFVFISHLSAGR